MSSTKIMGALLLTAALVACGDSRQSTNPLPSSLTGNQAALDYSWCFIHDSSVAIKLINNPGGIDVLFTTDVPDLLDPLRGGVLKMAGVGRQSGLGDTHLRPYGKFEQPGSGEHSGMTGEFRDLLTVCHQCIQSDLLPQVAIKVSVIKDGACMTFTPIDPMERDVTRSAVRGYFYGLSQNDCTGF